MKHLKVIPPDAKNIMWDFYETLTYRDKPDNKWKLRKGIDSVLEFLDKNNFAQVVTSDGSVRPIKEILKDHTNYFIRIYGENSRIDGSRYLNWRNGTPYKNFGKVCEDRGWKREETVVVSDDFKGRDSKSAEESGIRLVKVPPGTWDQSAPYYCIIEVVLGLFNKAK